MAAEDELKKRVTELTMEVSRKLQEVKDYQSGRIFSVGRFKFSTSNSLPNGALMPLVSSELYGSESMFGDEINKRIGITQGGLYRITVNMMIVGGKSDGTATVVTSDNVKTMQVSSSGRQYFYSFINNFNINSTPWIEIKNAFQSDHYEVIVEVEKLT